MDGWFALCVCVVRTRCGEGMRFIELELLGGEDVEDGMSSVLVRAAQLVWLARYICW